MSEKLESKKMVEYENKKRQLKRTWSNYNRSDIAYTGNRRTSASDDVNLPVIVIKLMIASS